jgi:hypothetical protein
VSCVEPGYGYGGADCERQRGGYREACAEACWGFEGSIFLRQTSGMRREIVGK